MRFRTPASIFLALLALVASGPTVAKAKIVSERLDREIVIDGEPEEWRDRLVYVDSADTFVGLLNDERFLYVCLYSRSPQVTRELAASGMRLRIESKSGGKRSVVYPKAGDASANSVDVAIAGESSYALDVAGSAGVEAASTFRGSLV